MRQHDNWDNYEATVEAVTEAMVNLNNWLDGISVDVPAELRVLARHSAQTLSDPLCALQEARTWSQARSALLFWEQRFGIAEEFCARGRELLSWDDGAEKAWGRSVVTALNYANQLTAFCLAELNARLVAFRNIRPQSVGAAGRIAYLEHRHN